MSESVNWKESITTVISEVVSSVLYLAGVAVIELGLRPLFGGKGVPTIADWILTLGDLFLLLTLLRRVILAVFDLLESVWDSRVIAGMRGVIKRSKAAETSAGMTVPGGEAKKEG